MLQNPYVIVSKLHLSIFFSVTTSAHFGLAYLVNRGAVINKFGTFGIFKNFYLML